VSTPHRFLSRLALAALCGSPATLAAQSARVRGTITDSVHHAPLADATVLATPVAPTRDTVFHSARTNAQGRYALEGLGAGRYVISVEHAFTDSIGLSVAPREVQLMAESTTTAGLGLPSIATLRHALCRAAESDTTLGVMLGAVRGEDGETVVGATVVFEWTDIAVDRKTLTAQSTRMTASTTTDSSGIYRACGLPTATALLVQAQHGAKEQSGIIEERIGEAGVLVRELALGDTLQATTTHSAHTSTGVADSGTVHGVGLVRGVVLGERGRPVGGAQVRLFGTSRTATTDAGGAFGLADIPTGTQGFEIVALGYLPRRFRAEVSASTTPVRLSMSKVAAVLDSVRVTASRQQYGDRFREFDERKRLGMGQYVTATDVERRNPFLATDLLRQMSGFAVVEPPDGSQILAANRGVMTLRGLLPGGGDVTSGARKGGPMLSGPGGRACPQVYIDGMPSTTDVDQIPPTSIYGIEVYREGQEPPKYGGFCGVILIWTK
jgi:hypothetical protein